MKEQLSDGFCRKTTTAGRYADGGNLYFLVKPDGRKSWVFRFVDPVTGKRQDMGLGPYGKHYVTLAKAREAAADARGLLEQHKNPIDERKRQLRAVKAARTRMLTFRQCTDRYIDMNKSEWKNAKHTAQWSSTLETYAAKLMDVPVADVDTDMVVSCLTPHWTTKTETMTRVRQRIEAVLAWATVSGYRSGDNPAQWQNHLDKILPKPTKLKKVKHRPALDYHALGNFMAELRKKDSLAAKAVELLILTAARPAEIYGAKWGEFNLDNARITVVNKDNVSQIVNVPGVWTIPGERMKAGIAHEIPLSKQAVILLKSLPCISDSEYLFPGVRKDKPMSTDAGMKLLKEIHKDITQHGFRSTFRDWAGESTGYPREVIEMALAHRLKDKAEAAYARGNLIDKRRRLMKDWADYCDTIQTPSAGNVTPIRKEE